MACCFVGAGVDFFRTPGAGWGRDFAAGVGGETEAIEKEVMQRCGHGIQAEAIKLAVQDAVERRKPRR